MSGTKRKMDIVKSPASKKSRTHVTIETKLKVLRMFDEIKNKSEVARRMSLTESYVRKIVSEKTTIESLASQENANLDKCYKKRSFEMEEMERLLTIWILDCNKKRIPVSMGVICTMAKKVYQQVIESNPTASSTQPEPFNASHG